jgi:hypothetical protein
VLLETLHEFAPLCSPCLRPFPDTAMLMRTRPAHQPPGACGFPPFPLASPDSEGSVPILTLRQSAVVLSQPPVHGLDLRFLVRILRTTADLWPEPPRRSRAAPDTCSSSFPPKSGGRSNGIYRSSTVSRRRV